MGPLTPLFLDAAAGVAQTGFNLMTKPTQTMQEITHNPQRILGL